MKYSSTPLVPQVPRSSSAHGLGGPEDEHARSRRRGRLWPQNKPKTISAPWWCRAVFAQTAIAANRSDASTSQRYYARHQLRRRFPYTPPLWALQDSNLRPWLFRRPTLYPAINAPGPTDETHSYTAYPTAASSKSIIRRRRKRFCLYRTLLVKWTCLVALIMRCRGNKEQTR